MTHRNSHLFSYAFQHKLKIILEKLTFIREKAKKGEGSDFFRNKGKNRIVNSWPYHRIQFYIEYKAKEHGIPVIYIHPHYTSQDCSYCGIIGKRIRDTFICTNKRCQSYKIKRNSDRNAAFNIAKRSLVDGGIVK